MTTDGELQSVQVQRRPGGRSARVRDAVLHATVDALAEIGLRELTVSEISRRADVHATSIQRRWGSVEAVVLDALLAYSEDHLPIPDTGQLRGDLVAFATKLAAYLDAPLGDALARALAAAQDDSAVAENRARFWRARLAATSAIVSRAIDRGELPTGTDPGLILEQLIAPIHFRHLLTAQPTDSARIAQIVDLLLVGAQEHRSRE